jgi:hypothetical protein
MPAVCSTGAADNSLAAISGDLYKYGVRYTLCSNGCFPMGASQACGPSRDTELKHSYTASMTTYV